MTYRHGTTTKRAETVAQRLREAETRAEQLEAHASSLTGVIVTLRAEVDRLREQRQEAAADIDRLSRQRKALRRDVTRLTGDTDTQRALWLERYPVRAS